MRGLSLTLAALIPAWNERENLSATAGCEIFDWRYGGFCELIVKARRSSEPVAARQVQE